jgi:restriction system protein
MRAWVVRAGRVTWIRTDVRRTALDQDLLYSLGATQTVFSVERNNALARFTALRDEVEPPRAAAHSDIEDIAAAALTTELAEPDFERSARDLIAQRIGQNFRGHDLERLVEAVLEADGYRVDRTRQGTDGGVDLLAGHGELGFDPPCICVQIKSSDYPEDVKTIRELQGAIKNFGAEHGLFVSWGGFKSSVYAEGRRAFFQIRLWTADDLIDAVLELYDWLAPIFGRAYRFARYGHQCRMKGSELLDRRDRRSNQIRP